MNWKAKTTSVFSLLQESNERFTLQAMGLENVRWVGRGGQSRSADSKNSLLDVVEIDLERLVHPRELSSSHHVRGRADPEDVVGNLNDGLTGTSDTGRVRVPNATTGSKLHL